MEEKIFKELQDIKKELQDIRSILEPKKISITIDGKQFTTITDKQKYVYSSLHGNE